MNFDKFMGWPEEDFTVWSYMQDPNDKLPDGHLGVASHKHLAVLFNDKINARIIISMIVAFISIGVAAYENYRINS